MKRMVTLFLLGWLLVLWGCSGDKDRNINTGKDIPRSDAKAE